MRLSLFAASCAVACLCFPSRAAAEWVRDGEALVYVADVRQAEPVSAPLTVPRAVTIPPGFHSHRLADGSTIVHADTNFGDPVAHAGVVGRNWPKTGFPGDTVIVGDALATAAPAFTVAGDCPNGRCPVQGRSVAVSGGTTRNYTVKSVASGVRDHRPVRRLLGVVFRPFRALRGGGCP
jgi:hypothetical protein